MDYPVNDAMNVFCRCGIKTVPTLMKHLKIGQFQISERTVRRKVEILKSGKKLEDKRKGNKRPKILSEADMDRVENQLQRKPESSAPELVQSLKLNCSPSTMNRELKNFGFRYMRILKHKQQRIKFANDHSRDHQWKNTFFLDESKFEGYSRRFACYQKSDSRVIRGRPKHPPKINLIGMISYYGPTRLILFTEDMDAKLFLRFFKLLQKDAKGIYSNGR